jgi:hypothetical protein
MNLCKLLKKILINVKYKKKITNNSIANINNSCWNKN